MIIDTVENLEKYALLHPWFPQAIRFLQTTDLMNHEEEVVHLQDDDLFVNITSTPRKEASEALLETHNRYIDIQLPLSGEETMGYAPRAVIGQGTAYSEEKDISFYTDKPSGYVTLKPGMFAIFFPDDAHAPAITPVEIKKVIVKVKI